MGARNPGEAPHRSQGRGEGSEGKRGDCYEACRGARPSWGFSCCSGEMTCFLQVLAPRFLYIVRGEEAPDDGRRETGV